MSDLSPDLQAFLKELIRKYTRGERDEYFAEWAAVTASFLLEFRGQLF